MTSIIITFNIIIIIIIINILIMTINEFYQSLYLHASLSKQQNVILSSDGLLLCIIRDIGSTEQFFSCALFEKFLGKILESL